MFALEISFHDNVSQPEMLFLRRPQGLIGSSDYAHVVVEDMKQLDFQVRVVREVGRRFRCKPIPSKEGVRIPPMLDGTFEGETSLDLGNTKLHIVALDIDLVLRDAEPPDRAGVRILRQSCAVSASPYPALVVRGNPPMVISFPPDQPLYVGRSKQCGLRLDAADISARHARVGYESGKFWVEDLGSTNGTFVNGQQISGRMSVDAETPFLLGREVVIIGVSGQDQLQRTLRAGSDEYRHVAVSDQTYPIIISGSEVARPARLVLPRGAEVVVGREPGCDMFLGAPHVSRKHCIVRFTKVGDVEIEDSSTNGTAVEGGVLRKGDVLSLENKPRVLDFGAGVTVAVCFNEEEEKTFLAHQGSPWTFSPGGPPGGAAAGRAGKAPQRLAGLERGSLLPNVREFSPAVLFGIYQELPLKGKAVVVLALIAAVAFLGIFVNLLIGVLL